MTTLVLVRGLPGSGKTTLVRPGPHQHSMFRGHTVTAFSADDFFESDGEYRFDPSKISEAHAACQENTRHALSAAAAEFCAVHNTFVRLWETEAYARLAAEFSVPIRIVSLWGAVHENVHGVPEGVLRRMAENWEGPRVPGVWDTTGPLLMQGFPK